MSISQTKEGFWIIDGDTHIGKWVRDSKRLDHDQNSLPVLKAYVRKGDYVMDVGANIGDHTIAYAEWVGSEGHVIACECNREAIECLVGNTKHIKNVEIFPHAIYSSECTLYFEEQENTGASFVTEMIKGQPVQAYTIDGMFLNRLDYLKIDAEGCETEILKGAESTIRSLKPIIVMEVNTSALIRAESSEEELLNLLRDFKYTYKYLFNDIRNLDQYDIIARYEGFKEL